MFFYKWSFCLLCLCKQSHQTEEEREEEKAVFRVVDDSLWLCIADESCLAPRLLWQQGSAARQKRGK